MKKILMILMTAIMSISLFAACSDDKKENTSVDISKVISDIEADCKMTEMKDMTTDEITIAYSGLNDIDCEEIKGIHSSDPVNADEIMIVKVKDSENVDSVKDIFNQRIEARKNAFQGYAPEQYEKLETALVKVDGNYVILCVASDASAAEKAVNDAF